MSLIALTSEDQNPAIFKSYFPQPIQLATRSQVCLQKFIHYRDSTIYNVNAQNNRLYFVIGNTQFDAKRLVVLPLGEYTGDALATQIATSMNDNLHQQNYKFVVVHSEPTVTDDATFEISYESLPTPSTRGGNWEDFGNTDFTITNNDTVNGETEISYGRAFETTTDTAMLEIGALVHNGSIIVGNIAYDAAKPVVQFGNMTVGCVRDILSDLGNPNPNLAFDAAIQDIAVCFKYNIQILVAKETAGITMGNPNWINGVVARTIPNAVYQLWDTVGAGHKGMVRYRATTTLNQVSKRVFVQIEYSTDKGVTYQFVADAAGGNDPAGNPYVMTKSIDGTQRSGLIYDSATALLNDSGAVVQNAIQSRRAPFIPTVSFSRAIREAQQWDFANQTWESGNGTITYTFAPYTAGNNDYDLIYTYTFNASLVTRYCYYSDDMDILNINNNDTVIDATPDNTLTNTDKTDPLSSWAVGSGGSMTPATEVPVTFKDNNLSVYGVFNPELKTVSSGIQNTPTFLSGNGEHQRIEDHVRSLPPADPESPPVLGADLSKQSGLWLRRLTVADISTDNKKAPLYLKGVSDASGNIGNLIGSNVNVISNTTSTAQVMFLSVEPPELTSKESTLHISVNEFPNVKSYEGGKNNTAKSIAIIPREEFTSGEDNNSLVYVAPFENWIDLNNKEMAINVFSMEVRRPDGTIATDLRPNTYAIMKLRQDPAEREAQQKQEQFDKLALTLSSVVQSGQILSRDIDNNNAQLGS